MQKITPSNFEIIHLNPIFEVLAYPTGDPAHLNLLLSIT